MKKAKSCCFIQGAFNFFEGVEEEKQINEKIKEKITQQIDYLIEKEQISEFYTGMEAGADLFYAHYLISKKNEKDLKVFCVTAFEEQAASFSEEERDRYFFVAEKSDGEIMINKKRISGCREKRDEFMTEKSDIIILLHNMNHPTNKLNLQKIDKTKKIIIIDPFNSKQNASFKCIV